MRTEAVFGLFALFVTVHFADAHVEGGRKCIKLRDMEVLQTQIVLTDELPGKQQSKKYRVDCRCRGGLLKVRECLKCKYETSTTTVATTEQLTTELSRDKTSVNHVTNPANAVASPSKMSDITSPNPGTSEVPVNPSTIEALVIITSENPVPAAPG